MRKRNIILVSLLVILIASAIWFINKPIQEIVSSQHNEGAILNLSGKYMTAVEWPPLAQVVDQPFSCLGSGEKKLINGRVYCITKDESVAAGNVYVRYSYATEVNGNTLFMTFSVRRSQCLNYQTEEKLECQAEQESFNPDQFIDQLVRKQIEVGTKNLGVITEPKGPSLSITPANILQGDPALININSGTSTVKSLTFNGKNVSVYGSKGNYSALIGLDLKMSPGTYPIKLTLSNGTKFEKNIVVGTRTIATAPLGIPEKLGGDTPESEKELIHTLVQEGAIISAVPSVNSKLWNGEFRLPIDDPVVITDIYGYSRKTGGSSISHKGTDFRAAIGTPVYAMNSGNVVFNQFLRNYGNTVIIDHGLGLQTIYMHLSESDVKLNQEVKKGDLIAKSGDTGYVLGPHLHLTVRIGGISIDPEKFMALMGPKS